MPDVNQFCEEVCRLQQKVNTEGSFNDDDALFVPVILWANIDFNRNSCNATEIFNDHLATLIDIFYVFLSNLSYAQKKGILLLY